MEIYREIAPLQRFLNKYKFRDQKVGLVPTMGALHEGHLSLLGAARRENDITVCSIYVNPTQFNNHQDLEKYPRLIDQDLLMLEKAGCDAVFYPSDDVIYQQQPKVAFDFKGLDTIMEGKYRPGHFSGVGLIVCKLFNIVAPDRAYFGQKDLQQYLIIKELVKDLSFNVKPVCMPIIREPDGLAMSSRNQRLSPEGRAKATILYRSLQKGQEMILNQVEWAQVSSEIAVLVQKAGVKLDYYEMVDPDTLQVVENKLSEKNVALCVAGYIEDIRLIDNVIF